MKVVFLENYSEAWYLAWDIREVRNWFARNFLIPKQIALPATEKIIAWTEDLRKKWEEIRESNKLAAKSTKVKLSWKTLAVSWKSDWDTLYAAITEKMIAAKIKEEFWMSVEERFIKDWHIKTLWAHQVSFVMNDWVSFKMNLEITCSEWKWVKVKKESKEKAESKEEEKVESVEEVEIKEESQVKD